MNKTEKEILDVYLAYGIEEKNYDVVTNFCAYELDNKLNTNFVSGYDETMRDRVCVTSSSNF